MFFDRGTFWVLPLTYFYIPKSDRVHLFPQSVKINYFCSGPISVDPICPQPKALLCPLMLRSASSSSMRSLLQSSALMFFGHRDQHALAAQLKEEQSNTGARRVERVVEHGVKRAKARVGEEGGRCDVFVQQARQRQHGPFSEVQRATAQKERLRYQNRGLY